MPGNPSLRRALRALAAREESGKGHFVFLRLKLAPLLSESTLLPWNPRPNDGVYDMQLYKDRLLVSGEFSSVDGQARGHFVDFDLTNEGAMTSFDPNFDWTPLMMQVHGQKLITSGWFEAVGGVPREGLAEIDLETGALGTLNTAGPMSDFWSVAVNDQSVFLIGEYYTLGGQESRGFTVINRSDNSFTTGPTSYSNYNWYSSKPVLSDQYLIFGMSESYYCNYLCVIDPLTTKPKE